MAGLKGTPSQRAEQKAARRRANEVAYAREQGERAETGHAKVVAATQAAKAASRHMTDAASRAMAFAIARVVERFDTTANREAGR